MANKIFEYGDIVYFLDSKGKIDTGTFCEYWHGNSVYIKYNNSSLMIGIDKLFNNEINLLLSLEKNKAKEIEENKKRLIEIQNSFPVLEQELFEIKNRIKKIGE